MNRFTTDNPQNNNETSLNLAYAKNSWVAIRGMEQPFLAYLRTRCMEHGCECDADESDTDTVMRMFDCATDDPNCPVALLHQVATQAAELRGRLKSFEDLCDLDHLRELLAAEKDGRLWVSPFPLTQGTRLYCPRKNYVQEQTVQYITLLDGEPSITVSFECDYECNECPHKSLYTNYEAGDGGCDGEYGVGSFLISEIGKTVFLTPEEAEAEAALQGEE